MSRPLRLEILLQSAFTVSLPNFVFYLYIFPFGNCSLSLPTSNPDPGRSVTDALTQEETEIPDNFLTELVSNPVSGWLEV